MKYEDLVFTVNDIFGKEIECRIISMIKKNDDELLAMFIDDEKDNNGNVVLKYGKIIKNNDDYELVANVNDEELEKLKEQFNKDLTELPELILNNTDNDRG